MAERRREILMKYQAYAFAKDHLNHAGTNEIEPVPITMSEWIAACKKIEAKWRVWRRRYLKEHPGDYPLRLCNKRSTTYYVNPIGKPEEMATYYINERRKR